METLYISIDNGVPQGSVLSPTLFSIFINDVPIPRYESSLFADDIAIWTTANTTKKIQKTLQDRLNEITKWARKWGVNFSPSKTQAIIFTNKLKVIPPKLLLNSVNINFTNKVKFLGIYFDKKANFNYHVENVVIKCKRIINLMRLISGTCWGANQKALFKILSSHITSYITYGAPVLITMSQANIHKLESTYNKALKFILKVKQNTSPEAVQVFFWQTTSLSVALKKHIKILR